MHSLEVIKALNANHANAAIEARAELEKARAVVQERPTDENLAAYNAALENFLRF